MFKYCIRWFCPASKKNLQVTPEPPTDIFNDPTLSGS